MRTDINIWSHGVRLSAWHYTAESEAWANTAGRPVVIMAHGFGATRDAGLTPFAERFQAAGADVVVFDYRGFGASEGQPRQRVDHRRHREDYRAVIQYVRTMVGVDPDRVVLWGSSYSGGHVVAVAAEDPRIAAVISQGAAMDGLAAVLQILQYAGPLQLLRLTGHSLLDLGRVALRREPHTIPIVGPPGSLAAITSDDGESGYSLIMGPTFENRMLARGILPILMNRPVTVADKLHMPLMLVVAAQDSIAPPSAVEKVAQRAQGAVHVERMDIGHFEIYEGEAFERSVTAQVAFLHEAVAPHPAHRTTDRTG